MQPDETERIRKAGFGGVDPRTIGWFPTHPSNPSKLIAHRFVNGVWVSLHIARFVPWPEAFPDNAT